MIGMLILALVVPAGAQDEAAVCRGSASAADNIVRKGPHAWRYSLVGLLDLNGDGISDRDRVHNIIKTYDEIDNEVDDHGRRSGKGLTRHTVLLLVGKIPDPNKGSPKQRAVARKIAEHHRIMLQEARKFGVHVVRFADFWAYAYHTGKGPKLRRPGISSDVTPSNFRERGRRTSYGRTSKIYGNSRTARP